MGSQLKSSQINDSAFLYSILPVVGLAVNLTELNISNNLLSSLSASYLSVSIQRGDLLKLEVLDLSRNYLTFDDTAELLVTVIKQCKQLTTVDLSHNYLDNLFLNRFDKLLRSAGIDKQKRFVVVRCFGNQFDHNGTRENKLVESFSLGNQSGYTLAIFKENIAKMLVPLSFKFDKVKYVDITDENKAQKKSKIIENELSTLMVKTKNLEPKEDVRNYDEVEKAIRFADEAEKFGVKFLFYIENEKESNDILAKTKSSDFSHFIEGFCSIVALYDDLRFTFKKCSNTVLAT